MSVPKWSDACPYCNSKQGWSLRIKLLLAFFVLAALLGAMAGYAPSRGTSEKFRKEKIERGFSAWDGSHRGLEKIIKESMNDPDSYKHEETVYWDKGDYLIVKTTFRGKNAFGGVVKNWVMAKADLDGNIIEVISQAP
ncbi:MAG: hypothetical protein AB1553_10525 [Nitrospirota bacterium]